MKKVSGKVNAIGLFHQASIVLSLLVLAFVFGLTLGASPLQATTYQGVNLTRAQITSAAVCTNPTTFIQSDNPTCYNLYCSSGGSSSGLGACLTPQQMIPPDYYAAISSNSWDGGAACGACAAMKGKQGATTVVIVDECTTCSDPEHLDIGASAYSQLMGSAGCATTLGGGSCSTGTGGGQGVNITCAAPSGPITWTFVQCPLAGFVNYNNASGDISYEYKSGGSSGWDPIQFYDALFPIAAVAVGTSSGGPFSTLNTDSVAPDNINNFWGGSAGTSNPSGTLYYKITDSDGNSVTTTGIGSLSVEQPTSNYGSAGVQFAGCITGPTSTFTNTPTNTSNITSTFTNTPTVTATNTPVLPPPGCPSYVYDGTSPHGYANLSPGGTNNESPSQTTAAAYTPGGWINGLDLALSVPVNQYYALFQGNWANYGVGGATSIPSTDILQITVNDQTAADLPMTFTISLSDWNGPGAVVGAQGVSQSAPVTEVITAAMGTGWQVFNIPMSSLSTGGTGYSLTDLGEFDWELLTTAAAETGTVYIGTVAFYGPCPPTSTFTNTPTNTATVTPTRTFTNTATLTGTNTPTNTATVTATVTSTNSATSSPTSTATHTATNTATITPAVTNTFTNTATNTPSSTATNSPTSTATHTATNTATITPAITSTFTNTATNSPTSTVTNTATNTSAITSTFTNTATNTPTHTATNTATITPVVTNTFTNTATSTPTSTATNTATITPAITNTFTNTFTNTATNTATKTSTNTATNTPTITATQTATNTATNTITGTVPPTDTPTITFTNTASSTATNTATNTSSSTATKTPTSTSSSTATNTSTNTAVSTATNSATHTATNTATSTATNTATLTSTCTMTNTPIPAPIISSLNPNQGSVDGGTVVVITGSNFLNITNVTLTGAQTTVTYTVNSSTQITFTTPPGLVGVQTLAVSNATGTSTTTFKYIADTATVTNTFTNTATITSTYTPTRTPTSTFTQTSTATITPTYTPTLSPDVLVYPPYPNPSTGSPITFNFQVPSESTVTMDVFTLAFRKISSQTVQAYGASTLQWDLKDISGIQVANGLYYVRFHVSGVQTTTKILKVLILR